jgi:hypothetical protein
MALEYGLTILKDESYRNAGEREVHSHPIRGVYTREQPNHPYHHVQSGQYDELEDEVAPDGR